MKTLPAHLEYDDEHALIQHYFTVPEQYTYIFNERHFDRWYCHWSEYTCVIDLQEFKDYQKHIKNFIYDRQMQKVFVNFASGAHPFFLACIYSLYQLKNNTAPMQATDYLPYMFKTNRGSIQDVGCEYLEKQWGLYMSSASKNLQMSRHMQLTPLECEMFAFYDQSFID